MNVAVVGAGAHATTAILPNLAPAGLRLVGVCARHVDRARPVAEAYGVPPFDDVRRMVEQTAPAGVVVIVPPEEFSSVISMCIDLRQPVFAEKPAARNAAEASTLADLADEAGIPIMVGYMKRFASGYLRAESLASKPGFGPLRLGTFTWSVGPMAERFDLHEWLIENPVHHLDLARYFFGGLHNVVARRASGREHSLVVTATNDEGAVVTIQATTNGSWRQHNESVELIGEGSSVLVDNLDTVIHRPPEGAEEVWRPNYTVPSAHNMSGATMGFVAELEHFRLVVEGRESCRSDMRNAATTLQLAAAIAEQVT